MLSARHIPNLLSGFRVAAAPLLVVLAEDGERLAFAFVMAAAFASDICDGFIARRFGFVSAFGSLLDSVADILLFSAILFGVWRFEQPLVLAHGTAFLAVLLLWLGGGALALLRYGKLASFHTRLTRLSAVALGLFVFILLTVGFYAWLFWSAVTLVILSQIEEIILIVLLPQWTPDVPGLIWHMRKPHMPAKK